MARELITSADAIVTLGGGINQNGELLKPSVLRASRAIDLLHQDAGAKSIILSGGASVEVNGGELTEAEAMRQFVLGHNVPIEQTMLEDQSLETIGNACWTKDLTDQHNWGDLVVVTSRYHVPRARIIFDHVFGPDYKIQIAGVGDICGPKRQLKEKIGKRVVSYAFWGTKAGDHEAIRERLTYLHPRYSGVRGVDLAMRHVIGAGKQLTSSHLGHPGSMAA